MRLTTKGRYAVTAMLDLALHTESAPIPLADISERQSISVSYLEQLFAKLRRRELVSSVRGPGGGYRLNQPKEDISVADIIAAVDESVDATRCGGQADCQDGAMCLTHHLWYDVSEMLYGFLNDITLASLVSCENVQRISTRQHNKVRERNNSIPTTTV